MARPPLRVARSIAVSETPHRFQIQVTSAQLLSSLGVDPGYTPPAQLLSSLGVDPGYTPPAQLLSSGGGPWLYATVTVLYGVDPGYTPQLLSSLGWTLAIRHSYCPLWGWTLAIRHSYCPLWGGPWLYATVTVLSGVDPGYTPQLLSSLGVDPGYTPQLLSSLGWTLAIRHGGGGTYPHLLNVDGTHLPGPKMLTKFIIKLLKMYKLSC